MHPYMQADLSIENRKTENYVEAPSQLWQAIAADEDRCSSICVFNQGA